MPAFQGRDCPAVIARGLGHLVLFPRRVPEGTSVLDINELLTNTNYLYQRVIPPLRVHLEDRV